ncbi:hypothetical protein ACJJIQ_10910 [Microbulbifer sp. ANSA003]|uniref:hypothetical protein n=1 Tax=Microbulbifer sp. ANSA003 TaxID=3243360 RepID=UPI00404199AB
MELSPEDIKKHRALVKMQRGYEISIFIALAILCTYFLGILDSNMALVLIGIELLSLSIAYAVNPVSKPYGNLLSTVINGDINNIINQHKSKS